MHKNALKMNWGSKIVAFFKNNCVRLFCARFGKISAPLNSKHLGTLKIHIILNFRETKVMTNLLNQNGKINFEN